jgi:predicted acylesterase/phospholipase RssA
VVLMINELTTARIDQQPPDVLITPDIPFKIGTFSGFTHAEEIIRAGQQAAEQRLSELTSLLPAEA